MVKLKYRGSFFEAECVFLETVSLSLRQKFRGVALYAPDTSRAAYMLKW